MPFILVKKITGAETQFERYLPADGLAVSEGQMLVHGAGGRLAVSGATVQPDVVSINSVPARTPQTEKATVIKVQGTDEFEVKTALTVTEANIGEKRTLSADGLNITSTTASGVFLITSTDGVTLGSTVRGVFRR